MIRFAALGVGGRGLAAEVAAERAGDNRARCLPGAHIQNAVDHVCPIAHRLQADSNIGIGVRRGIGGWEMERKTDAVIVYRQHQPVGAHAPRLYAIDAKANLANPPDNNDRSGDDGGSGV